MSQRTTAPDSSRTVVKLAASIPVYDGAAKCCYMVAKFFETDFGGNVIGDIRDIPFDESVDQWASNGPPEWTGNKWLVPFRAVCDELDTCRCYVASVDSIAAASPAGAAKIKLMTIYKGADSDESVVDDTRFIPLPGSQGAPASAAAATLLLNVKTEIDEWPKVLSAPIYDATIQPFKSKGRKIKKTTAVPFEAWDLVLTEEPKFKITRYDEYLSDFLVAADGNLVAVRADTLWRSQYAAPLPGQGYSYEGRVALLAVDDGYDVTEIGWQRLPELEYADTFPLLRRYGDDYWIVVRTNINNTYHYNYYLAIHKD